LDEANQHGIALRTDDLMGRCHDFLGFGNGALGLQGVDIHFICIEKKMESDVIGIFLAVSLFSAAVLLSQSPGCQKRHP
jgi:hypothetical protein